MLGISGVYPSDASYRHDNNDWRVVHLVSLHCRRPTEIQWITELIRRAEGGELRRERGCVDVRVGDHPEVLGPHQHMHGHRAKRQVHNRQDEADDDQTPVTGDQDNALEAFRTCRVATEVGLLVEEVKKCSSCDHEEK